MKKVLVVILGIVVLCSLSFAGDTQSAQATSAAPHTGVHKTMKAEHPLNNVIAMDASGTRTAKCMCGKEFQVSKDSPVVTRGDGSYYCCSEGCHDMYMKADKASQTKMFNDSWKTFPSDKMVTNAVMKDGKETATCLCGKTVDVTKTTPKVTENGVTMYLCSDACKTALHGMAANDRMDKELAVVKTNAPVAVPSTAPSAPTTPTPK